MTRRRSLPLLVRLFDIHSETEKKKPIKNTHRKRVLSNDHDPSKGNKTNPNLPSIYESKECSARRRP